MDCVKVLNVLRVILSTVTCENPSFHNKIYILNLIGLEDMSGLTTTGDFHATLILSDIFIFFQPHCAGR
ncbi:Uncharacterised protein [Candidatus Venteria ishoeyi]|uniref:Uncharacterized protein n=1 Tax=Candidatus Venteria ishoeyi TaxID=1899563 RepID=A0A1H6FJ21_9GAMM|nr:Uncharacterised protein [Candidatus Venteria ishoeyi]